LREKGKTIIMKGAFKELCWGGAMMYLQNASLPTSGTPRHLWAVLLAGVTEFD